MDFMLEHGSLATLLRTWRERADPVAAGLGGQGRRRARGLRREELAELAGVSVDYIKRLEQGRGHPSAGVVNSLARALRLDRADYEHLCAVTGHAAADGRVPRQVGPGPERLLERLDGVPVCLCDAAWTVLAWNPSWEALRCGPATGHRWDRNVAWRAFTEVSGPTRRTPERRARFASTLVADLRAALLRYPADEQVAALVGDLRRASGTFAELWESGSAVRYHDDQVTIDHPVVGEFTADCDLLTFRDGDLRAIVFTAEAGSGDAERLRDAALPTP
jgi:transcriptional regulator with XRE-family HTH domain